MAQFLVLRRRDDVLPESLTEYAQRGHSLIDSDARGTRQYFSSDRVHAWCLDLGAFETPCWRINGNHLLLIAGDPVVANGPARDFAHSVGQVGDALLSNSSRALKQARGTYCAASVNLGDGRLAGATDKLGVRGLYYFRNETLTIVSSSVCWIRRVLGQSATAHQLVALQRAAIGFTLGNTSVVRNVHALPPGHTLVDDGEALRVSRYWSWNSACNDRWTTLADPSDFHATFMRAVILRLGDNRPDLAFLSGGMDSRAIVAALRSFDREVWSVGFGLPEFADRRLGGMAADALQSRHFAIDASPGYTVQADSAMSVRRLLAALPPLSTARPLLWSGDGGSVIVGHVYMDGPWAEREDFGDPATTLRELRQALSWKVPSTILRRSAARAVEEHIDACLRSEWAEIEGPDPLRKMHRLLIGTDQRQHLTFHNETIQYQGFELALPFFDSEVVQWILSRPARPFLRHAFYNQWIRSFGPSYSSVPWQHYPGHLPGPLPLPADLVVQWQAGAGLRRPVLGTSEAKILLFDALRGRLPSDVFHRLRVTVAALSTLMGLRNYEYALRQVRAVSNPLSAYDPGEISDS